MILRGASLIDGSGRDLVPDASITIADGRFTAIGGRPAAAAEDVSGLFATPGLIDAHTHFAIVGQQEDTRMSPAVVAGRIFENLDLALDAGFTTARDVGGIDGGVAHAVDDGLIRGPRIFPSGPILCQCGGHGDFTTPWLNHRHDGAVPGLAQLSITCDGPDEVRRAARLAFKRGATQIKVCISGGVVSHTDRLEDTQFSVEELRAAVEEADARETYVTAHAHNVRSIRNGLEAGISCFEHVSFLDEQTAALIVAAGAVVVPTLAVTRILAEQWREWGIPESIVPRILGVEEAMARSVKLAAAAGAVIGSGSDLLGPRQNRRGLELVLKSAILGPMTALVSATQTNAQILRQTSDLGTVTEGKIADLVLWDSNPLDDPEIFDNPSHVVMVIKNGQIVKDTRT